MMIGTGAVLGAMARHGKGGILQATRLRSTVPPLTAVALGMVLAVALACWQAPRAQAAVSFADGSSNTTVPFGTSARVVGSHQSCGLYPEDRIYLTEYLRIGPESYTALRTQVAAPSGHGAPFAFTISPGPGRMLDLSAICTDPGTGPVGRLHLNVGAQPTLAVRDERIRNGKRAFFSGAIPAVFPAGKPALALQARSGRKWRTFKVLQVANDGSFTAQYRFTRTLEKRTYAFRVKPLEQDIIYPFLLSRSKKAKVTVKP